MGDSELWSCVKVEVVIPAPDSLNGLCGRKATLNSNYLILEHRSCVKVKVAVLGSMSLIVLMVSVDVKQTLNSNFLIL